jgi:folate-dependent phosphoribosylglycinamide formyltransferase PurN
VGETDAPAAGQAGDPFRVVVLTCDMLGLETAVRLDGVPGVRVVALCNSPHRRLPLQRRIRRVWRTRGLAGFVDILFHKARRAASGGRATSRRRDQATRVPVLHVADLHNDVFLAELRSLRPDLAVVDGTYLLRPKLFRLPRLGSINLHCGKVPEYRGLPPAFWELYDGVETVGVTVHQVEEELDAGAVYLEREFPLETAPAGDPLNFAREYWETVLRPNGIEMLADVVKALAEGTATARPQTGPAHPARTAPDRSTVRELRRLIRARRSRSGGTPQIATSHRSDSGSADQRA